MKTSISFDEDTIKAIHDFRRKQEKIPSISKAIIKLIYKGLSEIPKESFTEIPKDTIRLENLTLRIREPSKDRGGSSLINIPYKTILDCGFKDLDKIDLDIKKRKEAL